MTPQSVRDALGLARAMLRAEQDAPRPSSERIAKLERIIIDLGDAYAELAERGTHDISERGRWLAGASLNLLVSCVGTYDTLLPIVEAARRAVTGLPAPGVRGQREER